MNEHKFIKCIRVCMIDNLSKYLSNHLSQYLGDCISQFHHYWHDPIRPRIQYSDLFTMITLCKDTKRLFMPILIQSCSFLYSGINKMSVLNRNHIRCLRIDTVDELNDGLISTIQTKIRCLEIVNIHRWIEMLHFSSLVPKLELLRMNVHSYKITKNIYPQTLKYLILDDLHQKLTKSMLPDSLLYLRFSYSYRYHELLERDVLPIDLKELVLDGNFNTKLKINVLPEQLVKLKFGPHYEQPIEPDVLPSSLLQLTFGYYSPFNHPFDLGTLPINLVELIFDQHSSFNQSLGPGILPNSLKTLILGRSFNQSLTLPPNLEYLTLGDSFNQPISFESTNLIELETGIDFNQPLSRAPIELTPGSEGRDPTELTLCQEGNLPRTLKKLKLGEKWNHPLESSLPDNLEYIEFGKYFNQKLIPGILPRKNLRDLIFGYSFNQPITAGILPVTLRRLVFGFTFNQPFVPKIITPNIHSLTFGPGFTELLTQEMLPKSLTHLFGYNNVWDIRMGF